MHSAIITSAIAALLLAAPATAQRAQASAPPPAATEPAALTPEAAELQQAFHFAFPLYAMARTRAGAGPANTLVTRTTLADATSRNVTTPNNDTLYASAWLDLAAGPVIFTLPEMPGRYHSASIMNMAGDSLAILGSRTGGQGARYALIERNYEGPLPEGTLPLRLDCRDCWLLIRVLVKGTADLETAQAAMAGASLEAPAVEASEIAAPARPDGPAFLAAVNQIIARNPRSNFASQSTSFAGLGADPASWTAALPGLTSDLAASAAQDENLVSGWSYPAIGVGDYTNNHLLRAQTALTGLGALPRIEAMYVVARSDAGGGALSGNKAYSLRIPYALPIGGFWSLSLYKPAPDGRLFFAANPLDRFAVGDRSEQLRADRDGSTEIFIQSNKPQGERVVNWLPAPEGPFVLIFRAYLPRAEFLDGSFRLPAVQEAERIPS